MQCNRLITATGANLIKQALPIIIFFGIFTMPARAQETVLNGYVLELGNGEPLRYVEIKNLGTGALAESLRSEEHTSELQSLMRISYAVFSLKKKNTQSNDQQTNIN